MHHLFIIQYSLEESNSEDYKFKVQRMKQFLGDNLRDQLLTMAIQDGFDAEWLSGRKKGKKQTAGLYISLI